MEALPASVPIAALKGSWELSPIDERDMETPEQGPDQPRRRYTRLKYRVTFDTLMQTAQFQYFKGFFFGSTNQGADKFTMTVFDGEEYRTGLIVEFARTDPFSATDFAIDMTKVTWNLVVHNLPIDGA